MDQRITRDRSEVNLSVVSNFLGSLQFLIESYLVCTSHKDRACMLIVSATINMPQTLMYKGLEACHVNRLIVFAYL